MRLSSVTRVIGGAKPPIGFSLGDNPRFVALKIDDAVASALLPV
jgi:hypothetical protein